MTRTRAVRAAALTAAALASSVLAGTATAVAAPAVSHHRATVVVHTTAKHKVVAPASTRPGVARIKNTGKQPVFLVTPRHGAGKATLARDLRADTSGGLVRDFTVADTLPGSATTYLHLSRGIYYLADISADDLKAAAVASVRVTGAKRDATVPQARAVVVTSRNTLTSPATIGTTSVVRVRNASSHLQAVWLWRVDKNVTDSELAAFLAKPSIDGLFDKVSGGLTFQAMLSPTLRATSTGHHSAGRYLFVTLTYPGRSSGEPRLVPGGVQLVTVK